MKLDSYKDAGLLVSEALVNELDSNDERDLAATPREAVATLSRILAMDPPSVAQLTQAQVPAFVALARRIRSVFADLHDGAVDAAAVTLNELLATHPAHPHLSKERGVWRLHHHPHDARAYAMPSFLRLSAGYRLAGAAFALMAMWAAIFWAMT